MRTDLIAIIAAHMLDDTLDNDWGTLEPVNMCTLSCEELSAAYALVKKARS